MHPLQHGMWESSCPHACSVCTSQLSTGNGIHYLFLLPLGNNEDYLQCKWRERSVGQVLSACWDESVAISCTHTLAHVHTSTHSVWDCDDVTLIFPDLPERTEKHCLLCSECRQTHHRWGSSGCTAGKSALHSAQPITAHSTPMTEIIMIIWFFSCASLSVPSSSSPCTMGCLSLLFNPLISS